MMEEGKLGLCLDAEYVRGVAYRMKRMRTRLVAKGSIEAEDACGRRVQWNKAENRRKDFDAGFAPDRVRAARENREVGELCAICGIGFEKDWAFVATCKIHRAHLACALVFEHLMVRGSAVCPAPYTTAQRCEEGDYD